MIYFGQDKMSEFYYGGTEIKEMYLGNTKVFQNKHPLFLTLETDGHGTLSADVLSGFEGDTVTLTPTYNTYYRFSGYDCTGGSIASNTFTFGTSDATAKAFYKPNAFTASGDYLTCKQSTGYLIGGTSIYYARCNYKTSNVPSNYITSVTSTITGSRVSTALKPYTASTTAGWNPSNVSNYKVSGRSTFGGKFPNPKGTEKYKLSNYVGSTQINTQTKTEPATGQGYVAVSQSLTYTSTLTGKPSIRFSASDIYFPYANGVWSATGYAP